MQKSSAHPAYRVRRPLLAGGTHTTGYLCAGLAAPSAECTNDCELGGPFTDEDAPVFLSRLQMTRRDPGSGTIGLHRPGTPPPLTRAAVTASRVRALVG